MSRVNVHGLLYIVWLSHTNIYHAIAQWVQQSSGAETWSPGESFWTGHQSNTIKYCVSPGGNWRDSSDQVCAHFNNVRLFTWQVVTEGDGRVHVESTKGHCIFTIEGAERQDEGIYSVVVRNQAGEDTADINVKVVGETEFDLSARAESKE